MKKKHLGLSYDKRTNLWRIKCDCGKEFEPRSTMCRYQIQVCPKCGKEEVMDLNDDSNCY
jgi:predicted RNA-binding Zn-ribbon protein involved in translation (DUF1610 family)